MTAVLEAAGHLLAIVGATVAVWWTLDVITDGRWRG